MSYAVKEIFFTLQGEGAHVGRPAVFCRFAGCNLWSGRETDRHSAICRFCDTDFVGVDGVGGGHFPAAGALAAAIDQAWPVPEDRESKYVVCTGGEPLLQLDRALLDELHRRHFEVAVETNGTVEPPAGIDWICVSPKAGTELNIRRGNELKFVYPQEAVSPEDYRHLEFERFSIQPMDGPDLARNTALAIDFCKAHPRWRLSIQTHKVLNLP